MNSFVDRIDELLKTQKKNRNDLYNNLGIAKNLIGQWKQKGTIPSALVAYNIALYLGTSVEYLLTGEESDGYKDKYDDIKSAMQKVIDEK